MESNNANIQMQDWNERTYLLLGREAADTLATTHVMIVGVGGVGAYAAEMIARAGVGRITIVDGDVVSPSNINRQLPALHSTIGLDKVAVMQQRIADINPEAKVEALKMFITPDSVNRLLVAKPDFVIDAIDSISPKVALIEHCLREGINIISSMGAGGRLDPTAVRYADISQTHNDGLARVVRTRLRKDGFHKGLTVVWSEEPVTEASLIFTDGELPCKRSSYGTVSYLPCIFGCMLAAHAINKLKKK